MAIYFGVPVLCMEVEGLWFCWMELVFFIFKLLLGSNVPRMLLFGREVKSSHKRKLLPRVLILNLSLA